MNRERQSSHISHVYSLWQDLSHHTIIFYLVTLTLKFDLLLKNFNLGHNLWTVRDRALIFHMCIPSLWQDLSQSHHTIFFDLVTLTLKFDLIFKNFNLGHNMNHERQGFHISHIYSLWQDLSHHTIIFDLVTLTLNFESHTCTLNVAI